MSILSQIIAYSPNKIDTETKARSLVQGPRNMYADGLTVKQQQKVVEAFPNTQFDFEKYPNSGVKKYLTNDQNKTNKDWTKVNRFKKKGFSLEMGKGLNVRGQPYKTEGKRLTTTQQEFIKSNFELPEGVKEWDFSGDKKYGIKQTVADKGTTAQLQRENLLARIARRLKEKRPWTVAADRGSTKGWMMLQMNRVYENELKNNPTGKLTYEPVFDKFNDRKIIVGFKDNTASGKGKTYYGLDKYSKKNATSWLKHGDYKQNQKLVDISKRALKQPNEVIMGLLKDKNFKGNNIKLNHLIHFLSGTEATSADVLKNAISRHHQSGVAFGSATDDLALTTRTINNKIKGIEGRIANNKILPEDIQTLKNNNVYVRGSDGTLYGSGKKSAIGQFKQIESDVARSLESGVDFKGKKFETKQLLSYLEKLGCGKSAGGRIMFGNGTSCAIKGRKVLENGLKNGFKNADDAVLAKGILKSGRFLKDAVSLRGLFGPAALAFTAAAEAGIVGYDMLSTGKSFKEAVGDSVFNYMLGDRTKIDSEEEFIKRLQNIKTGPSGLRDFSDEEIGKMQYFKENLKDMGKGFDLFNQLKEIEDRQETERGGTQSDLFSENAFQLDAAKDKIQADIQDYNRTGTPKRVTDYLLSDKATAGADALAKAGLLVEQDQLQDAGTGKFYQSPKGDKKRLDRLNELKYNIEKMSNPTKINEFGQMFMDATPGEQSYFMGRTDFMEGGIASLNVKK
jgi:hypothetical protein